MSLRVTRVQAEAAGAQTSGNLRVTRAQAEAAGGVNRPLIRVSRVQLQVLVARDAAIELSASNSLVFSRTPSAAGSTFNKSVSYGLIFGQSIIRQRDFATSNSLVFPQSASFILTGLQASHGLIFGHSLSSPFPITRSASHGLVFGHLAKSSLKAFQPSHSLRFTQSATKDFQTVSVTHSLIFGQTAVLQRIRADATPLSGSNALVFSQEAAVPRPFAASNQLRFSQSAATDFVRFIAHSLEFGHTPAVNAVRSRAVAQGLVLGHLVLPERGVPDLCHYTPTIAGGTIPGLPPPPPANPPLLTPQSTIQLFYPAVSPTLSVVLRTPELGDRDRLQFDRIFRESRGGTLDVAPGNQIKQKVLALTITGLKEAEGQAFLDFVEQTLGEEVGLLDWEGRSWRGFLITTADPLTRNRPSTVDASFEFVMEGQL